MRLFTQEISETSSWGIKPHEVLASDMIIKRGSSNAVLGILDAIRLGKKDFWATLGSSEEERDKVFLTNWWLIVDMLGNMHATKNKNVAIENAFIVDQLNNIKWVNDMPHMAFLFSCEAYKNSSCRKAFFVSYKNKSAKNEEIHKIAGRKVNFYSKKFKALVLKVFPTLNFSEASEIVKSMSKDEFYEKCYSCGIQKDEIESALHKI